MLYFEDLDVDCDEGRLEFYDGSSTSQRIKGLEHDICGDNKPDGVFTVDARTLQVVFVPKLFSRPTGSFSIIVTSYKEDQCPSWGYECDNGRCIHEDISCVNKDLYNACGDHSGCGTENRAVIIGISVGVSLTVLAIICIVVCCICCIRKSKGAAGSVQSPGLQTVSYNGQVALSQPVFSTSTNQNPTNLATYNSQLGQTTQTGLYNYNNQGFTSTQEPESPPSSSLSTPPPEYESLYPSHGTAANAQYVQRIGDRKDKEGPQNDRSASLNEQTARHNEQQTTSYVNCSNRS